jgi:hypothetical protein
MPGWHAPEGIHQPVTWLTMSLRVTIRSRNAAARDACAYVTGANGSAVLPVGWRR